MAEEVVSYGFRAVMIDKTNAGYPAGAISIINYLKDNYKTPIEDAGKRWLVKDTILYAFFGVETGKGGNNLDSFDKRTVSGVSVPNTYSLCQTNGIGVNAAIKICLANDCTLGQLYPVYKSFPSGFKVTKELPADKTFWNDEFKTKRQEKASTYFELSDEAKKFEKAKGNLKSYWDKAAKTLKADASFSTNIGAILLSKYILEDLSKVVAENINGKMVKMARLDWVITKYNAGPNAFKNLEKNKLKDVQADTSVFINIVPKYTQSYIIKMLGKDGLLDVQKRKLTK